MVLPAGRYLLRTVTQVRARSIYTKAESGIDLARIGYTVKAHVLLNGLRNLTLLSEPGTMLVLNIAVGVLARAAPQLSVWTCGRARQ